MTLLQEAAFPGLTPQSTRDPDFRRAASIRAACAPCAAAWGHDEVHLRAEACSHNRLHRKWRLGCRVSVTSWNFWRPVLGSKSAWVLSYMLSTQCPFWGVSARRLVQRAPKFGTSVVTQDRTIRCLANPSQAAYQLCPTDLRCQETEASPRWCLHSGDVKCNNGENKAVSRLHGETRCVVWQSLQWNSRSSGQQTTVKPTRHRAKPWSSQHSTRTEACSASSRSPFTQLVG